MQRNYGFKNARSVMCEALTAWDNIHLAHNATYSAELIQGKAHEKEILMHP